MYFETIEQRRENRIPITLPIRKLFLKRCREIAQEEGNKNKISREGLHNLREEYEAKVNSNALSDTTNALFRMMGFWNPDTHMLELLDQGIAHVESIDGDWFYYRDFNFYNTRLAKRVQIFGSPTVMALGWLFLFYLSSAVLFCPIMNDDAVCPNRDTYEGWLTAVYFGSVTMVSLLFLS